MSWRGVIAVPDRLSGREVREVAAHGGIDVDLAALYQLHDGDVGEQLRHRAHAVDRGGGGGDAGGLARRSRPPTRRPPRRPALWTWPPGPSHHARARSWLRGRPRLPCSPRAAWTSGATPSRAPSQATSRRMGRSRRAGRSRRTGRSRGGHCLAKLYATSFGALFLFGARGQNPPEHSSGDASALDRSALRCFLGANSAAIPPSKRLASPAPRRSRCSCGFIARTTWSQSFVFSDGTAISASARSTRLGPDRECSPAGPARHVVVRCRGPKRSRMPDGHGGSRVPCRRCSGELRDRHTLGPCGRETRPLCDRSSPLRLARPSSSCMYPLPAPELPRR